MKGKQSLLKSIVFRFIGCLLGAELVVAILESIFAYFILGSGHDFQEVGFLTLLRNVGAEKVGLTVLWGILEFTVYCTAVLIFARGISSKVAGPAQHMVKGFQEVSDGNLNVVLDFETETEFKEMRDTFNFMTQKLKDYEEKRMDMEQERMRLFSHIAHDLKTPITTISGYSGALASGMVDKAEKQLEYHLAIKEKSDQMNGLVDQLLSYSKLGAPQYQMNMTKADIVELLRTACASLFGEMEDRQVKLELHLPDEPVVSEVDPLEINRAVSNLLTNVLRHCPVGSLLSVGLREASDWIMIQIADSGPAIPEAIVKNLFEPFVLGDDSRGSGQGSGLGLPIVKKVMEQHNGEVFCSDANPPYTKMFVLKLPKGRGKKCTKS